MTQIADDRAIRMAELINESREDAGLDPLRIEIHLNDAARVQSEHMDEIDELTHRGPGGNSMMDRVKDSDFDLAGGWRVTENVGYTQGLGNWSDADLVRMHDSFMSSEGHYANIMDPNVSYIGVHVHEGSMPVFGTIEAPTLFFTMNFAASSGEAIVQDPDTGDLHLYRVGQFVENLGPASDPEPDEDVDHEDEDILGPPPEGQPPEEEEVREEDEGENSGSSGGCFVATAAYGDRMNPDVVALRRYRDLVMTQSPSGRVAIRIYQRLGPVTARHVRPDSRIAALCRYFLAPLSRRIDPGVKIRLHPTSPAVSGA